MLSYLIYSGGTAILTKTLTKTYKIWTFWKTVLVFNSQLFRCYCSLDVPHWTEEKLGAIVLLRQIIISSSGLMSGPESVAEGRETKRALDVWQWRGKWGFVPNGRKANCSKWNQNLIGREIKWMSFFLQMVKWGQMRRKSTFNHTHNSTSCTYYERE